MPQLALHSINLCFKLSHLFQLLFYLLDQNSLLIGFALLDNADVFLDFKSSFIYVFSTQFLSLIVEGKLQNGANSLQFLIVQFQVANSRLLIFDFHFVAMYFSLDFRDEFLMLKNGPFESK